LYEFQEKQSNSRLRESDQTCSRTERSNTGHANKNNLSNALAAFAGFASKIIRLSVPAPTPLLGLNKFDDEV